MNPITGLTRRVTKIPFVDVVKAINEYAFVASAYPLILSIEDHCCLAQQDFIAATFVEVFGDAVILQVEGDKTTWQRVSPNLPSLESLKYKILVKHKKQEPVSTTESTSVSVSALASQIDEKVTGFDDWISLFFFFIPCTSSR